MPEDKSRRTMGVSEMARTLGLKKTDSYWLVHKNYFETIQINGQMRILLSSFEHWYERQIKYHKVDGSEPGQVLRRESLSARDISELIGIDESCVYDLLNREHIETIMVDYWRRVPRDVFMAWIAGQSRYRLPEERARDKAAEESSMTIPEMGRILGVVRNTAYYIEHHNGGILEFIRIGGKKRVTKESFERWYAHQKRYVKMSDRPALAEVLPELPTETAQSPISKEKTAYTIRDVAQLLLLDEKDVYKLIKKRELRARKIGVAWRIMKDDYLEWKDKQFGQLHI